MKNINDLEFEIKKTCAQQRKRSEQFEKRKKELLEQIKLNLPFGEGDYVSYWGSSFGIVKEINYVGLWSRVQVEIQDIYYEDGFLEKSSGRTIVDMGRVNCTIPKEEVVQYLSNVK